MMQLFLEGKEVDLDKRFSTFLTFALDDIKDFGARKTTFSKEIILPGTKRNNQTLGNIFDINSRNNYNPNAPNVGLNFNVSVAAKAIIFNGNIQVFKGVLRLMTIIIDNGLIEYEVSVFGELTGFVLALGSKKIEELDFSAYNTTYTIANINASKANIGTGAGIVFAQNIDYGNYSTNKHDWQYKTIRPCIHVKEAIEKIIGGTNYAYDFPLLDTTRFNKLVIPHNQKKLTNISSTSFDVSGTTQNFGSDGTIGPVYHKLLMSTLTSLGSFTTTDNKEFTYTGTSSLAGVLNFKINGSFENSLADNLVIIANVGGYFYAYPFQEDDHVGSPDTFSIDVNVPATLVTGDKVFVTVSTYDDLFGFQLLIDDVAIKITTTSLQPVEINIGETIRINDTLPKNIFQKDFISSIIKLFNLYLYEDETEQNKLKITPYIDFYANASTEDWSNKIDRSSPIKIKPLNELTARYYDFDFASDSDYYNDLYKKRYSQVYGSYRFDSQYQFSNDSKKVQVIFAGTPLVGYNGEDKVYSTIFKWNGGVVGVGEEQVDSVIRILQCKLVTGVASWNILDGTTVLHSTTEYVYAGHLDNPDNPTNDINFGVPNELFFTLVTGALNINQFNVYWSSYMAEITDKDSRMLSAKFRLTKKDIAQLDFSKYKFIDGTLYRLSKILDYDADKDDLCNVELLKVINKIY